MKKDIPKLKVEDVAVAIVPESNGDKDFWEVYLVNLKDDALKGVLVNSKGYGEVKDQQVKTTTLRYFFEEVPGNSFAKIELLQDKLKHLSNEYWISFTWNGYLYDKKYIFVTGSLERSYFTNIPLLGKKGVMIL